MSYYTPTLSEFHVDFIYERVDESGYAISQVVMPTTPLSAIQQLLDEGSIRVKCLNEDDVEALGFRMLGREQLGSWGGEIISFTFLGTSYELDLRQEAVCSYITLFDREQSLGTFIYRGMCKNINELERILTHLSIHQPVQYASN